MRRAVVTIALLGLSAMTLFGDEAIRRAQEELRKRNLYFGDINGQTNAELTEALKRYQERKGFNATGQLDEETASSLKIQIAAARNSPEQSWPDEPVLKSDMARSTPEPEQRTLQAAQPETSATATVTPPPPAQEQPSKADQREAERLSDFIRDYLRDAEGGDIDAQIYYYEFPVAYFDHGRVNRDFVWKDTAGYCKRWPQRKYMLLGPVKFSPSTTGDKFQAEFTIAFRVADGKHVVTGKTRNFWTIHSDKKNFKILAINEQRLHD
jgi:hypothetical protein